MVYLWRPVVAAGVRIAPWWPDCVWVSLGAFGVLEVWAEQQSDHCSYSSECFCCLCFLITLPQVLYRWNRQSSASVIETNRTSVELSLPFDEDYIIEIKPFSDGGDGSSSEQIRIPKISSKAGEQVSLCPVSPQEQPVGLGLGCHPLGELKFSIQHQPSSGSWLQTEPRLNHEKCCRKCLRLC